jgi:ferritin-like metal-binding protein YciE
MATLAPTTLRPLYITGLRNAHALEHQALGVIDRQLDRLENFPEVADRLSLHRRETEQQIVRLDEILGEFNETPSGLKDSVLGMMGNMAAIGHAAAEDEILKNAFANCALENFEIASYRSLIVMAEESGFPAGITALQESLREEQAMARWCEDSIEQITRKYLVLHRDPSASSH